MDNAVSAKLGEIVRRYGQDVAADPRRVEALLNDLASGYRREIFILTGAAREGIPAELLGADRAVPVSLVAATVTAATGQPRPRSRRGRVGGRCMGLRAWRQRSRGIRACGHKRSAGA